MTSYQSQERRDRDAEDAVERTKDKARDAAQETEDKARNSRTACTTRSRTRSRATATTTVTERRRLRPKRRAAPQSEEGRPQDGASPSFVRRGLERATRGQLRPVALQWPRAARRRLLGDAGARSIGPADRAASSYAAVASIARAEAGWASGSSAGARMPLRTASSCAATATP